MNSEFGDLPIRLVLAWVHYSVYMYKIVKVLDSNNIVSNSNSRGLEKNKDREDGYWRFVYGNRNLSPGKRFSS